jgi:hypothetical protein
MDRMAPIAHVVPAPDERIAVPAWAWLLAVGAVLGAYLLTMENGALLGHTAENLHEFFHDARHFAGVPCH